MKSAFIALRLFLLMTALCGVLYPAAVTLLGSALFPEKVRGSLIERNGAIRGSVLIGQNFVHDRYFQGRPSAGQYGTLPASASNLSPMSAQLLVEVKKRQQSQGHDVPAEMLFSSGSGLDPHISPEAAVDQLKKVVRARRIDETDEQKLLELIKINTEEPQFGFLGQRRVNVLRLNLTMDETLDERK